MKLKDLEHVCWLAICRREINVGTFGHTGVLGTYSIEADKVA